MKAWIFKQQEDSSGLANLELRSDVPDLSDKPPAGFVKIKLKAVSLNPVDWKLMESPPSSWSTEHIPGVDGAGVVVAVGADVTELAVGSRVCLHSNLHELGTFAEYMYAPVHVVATLPDSVSFEEAAALPCAGLTAWQTVIHRSFISEGEVVFVDGAAGGVGRFVVQLATIHGGIVLASARSRYKETLLAMGAKEVIDWSQEDVVARIFSLTDGVGVQVVFDPLGGDEAVLRNFKMLSYAGRYVSILGRPEGVATVPAFAKCPSFHEVALGAVYTHGSFQEQQFFLKRALESLLDLVETKRLDCSITSTLPFSSLKEGLQTLKEGKSGGGKLVVQVDDVA